MPIRNTGNSVSLGLSPMDALRPVGQACAAAKWDRIGQCYRQPFQGPPPPSDLVGEDADVDGVAEQQAKDDGTDEWRLVQGGVALRIATRQSEIKLRFDGGVDR